LGKSDKWLENAEKYLQTAKKNGKVLDVGIELISELRSHQSKLEMQKKELQTILDSSRSYIFYKDKENRFLQVNKAYADILGMPQDKLAGMSLFDIFPNEQAENYLKDDKQVIKSAKPKLDIIEPMNIKNEIMYVKTDKIPYHDDEGNIIGIIGFAEDITRRKKAEEKLERIMNDLKRSNKELEQFAYVSSHDLKEPLRMITSFLQLLQKRYSADLDDDANDFINFAVEGAKRLDIMINDLLEYSRIGNKEREFEYLQGEKILETVLTNLKTSIEDNNVIITHDPLPLIYANNQQMVQLLQNLISNAIKYHSKEDPKIHISADILDDEYVFSIKDNGIGIDQKHLERIFTIFQRLHSRDEYEGTGIGLAISQKIVQKHHGKIWAESKLEKGTTFYFTIPNKNY
jgi:two-component system, chemotaxis family, sensor kinase Cph1